MNDAPCHLCLKCAKRGKPECSVPPVPSVVVEACEDFAAWDTLRSAPTSSGGLLQMHDAAERGKPFMSDEDRKKQVGGSHYKDHKIQPWDIILEYGLDFWEGNALKYLLRSKSNRLEDLKKARHYLDEVIRQMEVKRQ
jgi:hypothetical protein